jgi:hypothetical protein
LTVIVEANALLPVAASRVDEVASAIYQETAEDPAAKRASVSASAELRPLLDLES